MKYQWRITKYNPIFRNDQGHYLLDEWTCPSEVGKIINGKQFTLDEYLRVEAAYLDTIIRFLHENNIRSLRLIQVSNIEMTEKDKSSILYEKEFDEVMLQEDRVVNVHEIRTICKMILRNFAYSELFLKDEFFIHFGWDYYMYIGSNQKSLTAIEFATNQRLFVEECVSPNYVKEEDTTRQIEWSEIDNECIVGEEELKGIALEEYRKIFQLSEEHPVVGVFVLKTEQKDFFQKFLEHKMDFSKYEYQFWGGL